MKLRNYFKKFKVFGIFGFRSLQKMSTMRRGENDGQIAGPASAPTQPTFGEYLFPLFAHLFLYKISLISMFIFRGALELIHRL